ncbi:MAG: hypothetical protein K8T91_11105 [Planctomycetes bacterium]|nr:hypothetical protein [Planctomycetota bacterium]
MKRPRTPIAGLDQLELQAAVMAKRCQHVLDYLNNLLETRRGRNVRLRAKGAALALNELATVAASAAKRLGHW